MIHRFTDRNPLSANKRGNNTCREKKKKKKKKKKKEPFMRSFKDLVPHQGNKVFHESPRSTRKTRRESFQVKMSRRIVSVVSPPISGTMASRRRLVFSDLIFLSEPGSGTRPTNGRTETRRRNANKTRERKRESERERERERADVQARKYLVMVPEEIYP